MCPKADSFSQVFRLKTTLAMGGYLGKRRAVEKGIDRVCEYFPILKRKNGPDGRHPFRRRTTDAGHCPSAGFTSQVAAARRALHGRGPGLFKDQIFEQLIAIRDQEKHRRFILVEQDADVALNVAEYAYVLETGRVVMEGTK
jgi:branched-chain amino acid transport system ATP-binding protein